MKNVLKVLLLLVIIAVLVIAAAYSFWQQRIVDYVVSKVSEQYGVAIDVSGFDISVLDGRILANTIEIRGPHESHVRAEGIFASISTASLVNGYIVLPEVSVQRLSSKNVQKLAKAFARKEALPVEKDEGGIDLPFTLIAGRIHALTIEETIGEKGRLFINRGTILAATTSKHGLQIDEELHEVRFEQAPDDSYSIGTLKGSVTLEEDEVRINTLEVSNGIADIAGRKISILPRLQGEFSLATDNSRAPIPKGIGIGITSTVSLSGDLDSPRIVATIKTVDGVTLEETKRLDSVELTAQYVKTDSAFEITVKDLRAFGDAGEVRSETPLIYAPGKIAGDVTVDLREMITESYGFSKFGGRVHLDGSIDKPRIDSDLTLQGLYASILRFGDVQITTRYDHTSDSLTIRANESVNENGMLLLDSHLSFKDHTVQTSSLSFERLLPAKGIRVSGTITSSGPLDPKLAKAAVDISGELKRDSSTFPFGITAELKHGSLQGTVNKVEYVTGAFDVDFNPAAESRVTIKLDQPKLSTWVPSLACGKAVIEANVIFRIDDPMSASGAIDASKSALGCGRYAVGVAGKPIRLHDQKIYFDGLEFTSLAGIVRAAGSASREAIHLDVKGKVDLPFVGHFSSIINDVSGTGDINLEVRGSPIQPRISGNFIVEKGGGTVSQPPVELSDVFGEIEFDGEHLRVRDLRGVANDGKFNGSAEIALADPMGTLVAAFQLENVSLQPVQDVEVWLSAELQAASKEVDGVVIPAISGTVTVNDGKLEKQFDQAFIQERIRTWFESATVSMPSTSDPKRYPDLDITVVGDASFSVVTNIARADLSPKLAIKGNPSDLKIRGNVGIASGSFDVGRTHFEILSGRVSLWGQRVRLELFAEGEAKDENGFPVVISLELSGDATDPRVTLTSDNGLSQEEIVKLLAAGGGLGGQSLFDQAVSAAGLSEIGLLTEDSWISRLTGVDDLSIEPSYDLATGQTSSKVYTAKHLTDDIKVSGQFPFTGQGQSKISSEYSISPLLGIEASYRPPSAAFKSSAGLDLNWAIISQTRRWPVEFEGNERFQDTVLINLLGLSKRSRMSLQRLAAIERKIRRYYADYAYLDVAVTATCEAGCSYARIVINEGREYTVREIEKKGNLDTASTDLDKPELLQGKPATKALLLSIQKKLISAQRKQGYYRARIVVKFEKIPESNSVRIFVKGWKRQRYTIELNGNSTFPFEVFSKALRLEEQSFPFGSELPGVFITTVEQYYLERGYADLHVTSQLTSEPDLVRLHLDITEGKKFKIEGVKLLGSPIAPDDFEKGMSAGTYRTVFKPPVLYRAAVQYGRKEIQRVLVSKGYPLAEVDAQEVRLGKESAQVVYTVRPGPPQQFTTQVNGLPEDVQNPEVPANASLELLQRETERLKGRMSRAGYKGASVTLESDPITAQSRIVIVPGVQEKIDRIEILGNQSVEEKTIRETLALEPGDPLSIRALSQARNRLLKRGLFSEVSVTPDEKTRIVTVTVRERVLQSLSVTTGFDSEFGLHLGMNAIDRSFFSDGKELSVRGDVYYDYDEASLGRGFGALRFKNPNAFKDTEWSEELGFTNIEQSSFQEFDLTSVYFRSTLEFTIDSKSRLKIGHVAESLRPSSVPEDIILGEFDDERFISSALSAGVEYTDQDDPLTPRYSRRFALESNLARSEFGSDVDYLTVQPSFLFLEPTGLFDGRLAVLGSIRGGIGRTFGEADELPLPKRFRLGGQDSVRGYKESSLGPRGELGSVIGGDYFYQATTELRYELIEKLHVLSFLDVGNLWLESRGRERNNFGTGVGVRYSSPIGSLGADIGVPVNPEEGSRQPRLYLRLGATF